MAKGDVDAAITAPTTPAGKIAALLGLLKSSSPEELSKGADLIQEICSRDSSNKNTVREAGVSCHRTSQPRTPSYLLRGLLWLATVYWYSLHSSELVLRVAKSTASTITVAGPTLAR